MLAGTLTRLVFRAFLSAFSHANEETRVAAHYWRAERDLRNDLAHEGKCAPQTRGTTAEDLAAAIFAARFATFVRATVSANATPH